MADAAVSSAAAQPPATPGTCIYSFQEEAPDAVINIQIVDLGRQLYIWIAVGGARLNDLCFAISTPHDPLPSVATLLQTPQSGDASHSLAQRLTKRLERPVLCSCNLPSTAPMLQVIAERQLMAKLAELQLVPGNS